MHRSIFLVFLLAFGAFALRPASAVDGPFEVTEKVAASGQSPSEAYTKAVNAGRRRAWDTLVHRLTPQDQWAKLSTIDDLSLQRMVKSYRISDERRSTTRYEADVTYVFNEALLRHYFRTNNVAYSASAAAPMLVVPMAPNYAPDSPWSRAWAPVHMGGGVVPLVLPDADPLNRTALAGVNFATAAWSDVAPIAARASAGEVAVVQAGPGLPGHMAVGIRVLYPNQPPQALTPLDVPVPLRAAPDQAYAMAAQAAASALGEAWKARNAIDFSKRATIPVAVALDSLAAWGQIEQHLIKVPVVMNIRVEAMAIGQVRAVITYAGTQQQLLEQMGQAGFTLQNHDGESWLNFAPPPATP